MNKGKVKFYVVWEGRRPGVYNNWPDSEKQVKGYPGAKYRAFESYAAARHAFEFRYDAHQAGVERGEQPALFDIERPRHGLILPCLCVDGACAGVPGPMEYRGVQLPDGREIFSEGPLANGTNNIAEFLAIVHALRYCAARKLTLPVYSDSRNAISWVAAEKCKTRLVADDTNREIFKRIAAAEHWLGSHQYRNQILKWDTEDWGENPADFGRK